MGAALFFTSQSKNTFKPTDIAGCKLWLRADQGITLNGGNVSGFDDFSGGNFHASQAAAISQPLFNASDPDFNNKPSITFDGINDYLWRNNTDFNITGKTLTTYIVMKYISGSGNTGIMSLVGSNNDYDNPASIVLGQCTSGNILLYRSPFGPLAYGAYPVTAKILSLVDDGTTLKTYLNGVYVTQVASNQFYNTRNYYIGCRYVAGTPSYFSGFKLTEQITYETAAGTSDDTMIINYLKSEYGII